MPALGSGGTGPVVLVLLGLLFFLMPQSDAHTIRRYNTNTTKRGFITTASATPNVTLQAWSVSFSCRVSWNTIEDNMIIVLDWSQDGIEWCWLDVALQGDTVPRAWLRYQCRNETHVNMTHTMTLLKTVIQQHMPSTCLKVPMYSVKPESAAYVAKSTMPMTTQTSPPWHLDRISQLTRPLDGLYQFVRNGSGTVIYHGDTGARCGHVQLANRCTLLIDMEEGNHDPNDGGDGNGHGTHTLSLAIGSIYGVAKAAHGYVLRLLGNDGSGSLGNVIGGCIAIGDAQAESGSKPAVASFSFSGPADDTMDAFMNDLATTHNVQVFAAAGNNYGQSACNYSPGRASQVIAVGASAGGTSSSTDSLAPFSNKGPCTRILAPGDRVLGAWYTSNTASAILDGTSQATPIVAGVGLMWAEHYAPAKNAAQVATALLASSQGHKVATIAHILARVDFPSASVPTPAVVPTPKTTNSVPTPKALTPTPPAKPGSPLPPPPPPPAPKGPAIPPPVVTKAVPPPPFSQWWWRDPATLGDAEPDTTAGPSTSSSTATGATKTGPTWPPALEMTWLSWFFLLATVLFQGSE